jgi:tetratricopeptide (TPR) repeat protein
LVLKGTKKQSKFYKKQKVKFTINRKELCVLQCKEEEFEESEIRDELAVIQFQKGYAKQMLNLTEEAKEIYTQLIKTKPNDIVSIALSGNNLVTLREKGTDIFDSEKRIKFANSSKVVAKLSPKQKRSLNLNSLLIHISLEKFEDCNNEVKILAEQYPDSDIAPIVVASLLYKEKNYEGAIKTVTDFIEKYPKNCLRCKLMLAQMQISRNNFKESIQTLLKIDSIKYELSVIAAICSLYLRLNDIEGCVKYLDEASEKNTKNQEILLEKSASLKYENKMFKESVETYEKLFKVNPKLMTTNEIILSGKKIYKNKGISCHYHKLILKKPRQLPKSILKTQ